MSAEPLSSDSATEPIGRRARRKAETRARLLAAARRLFVERGYHATRPQDIAREADVAAGSFYTYFADKREAFVAFTREVGDELMAELDSTRGTPADDLESGLAAVLEALLDYSDAHPGVLGVAFGESVIASAHGDDTASASAESEEASAPDPSLRGRLAGALAETLREGMKARRIHDDYDADLIADAVVGLIHQGLVHGQQRPRAVVISNLTRFCGRALVAPGR